MAAPAVAAAGAAVALYFYSRTKSTGCVGPGHGVRCGPDGRPIKGQHFQTVYQAPNTWVEAMYFFAEALRCV